MKLSTALENSGITLAGRQDPEIASITNDSRKVAPGALFFALQGAKTDGSLFVKQALEKGAAAVISEHEVPPLLRDAYPGAAFITTSVLQRGLSRIAANFYGNPSRRMKIYGITGTKGKTTTAYLLESVLRAAGEKPGVIGTIDYRVDGKVIAQAANTTPLAHTLQELLAGMADAGAGGDGGAGLSAADAAPIMPRAMLAVAAAKNRRDVIRGAPRRPIACACGDRFPWSVVVVLH